MTDDEDAGAQAMIAAAAGAVVGGTCGGGNGNDGSIGAGSTGRAARRAGLRSVERQSSAHDRLIRDVI